MTDVPRSNSAGDACPPPKCETGTPTPPNKQPTTFDPLDEGSEDGYEFWGAVVHLIRVSFGSGILLLPSTMKTAGYVTSSLLLTFVSLFYYHNMHTLITHERRMCGLLNVNRLTYTSLAQKTFEMAPSPLNKLAPLLGRFLFAYFCMMICNSTYLLVLAGSVQNLIRYFDLEYSATHIVTAAMVPLLLLCTLRKMLQRLVPFSAATNLFSFLMAVALLISCAVYRDRRATFRPFDGDLATLPQTFALHLQAFTCTSSILPVKSHMKRPRRYGTWCGALNVAAVALTFLFAGFALVAYFCFGDATEQNILANLPADNCLSLAIHALYASSMFVVYLLWFSVLFDNVWPEIEPRMADGPRKWLAEYGLRFALNGWWYFVAIGVPNLSLMLTISGTVAIGVEIALVPVMELIYTLRRKRKSYCIVVKDVFILVVAGILFYVSLVDCVKKVIELHTK